jgi:hypothetical protein
MSVCELEMPEGIAAQEDADEFLRFWIAGGEDYVSLRVGAMGRNEVHQWGMILADLSVHIVRALRQNGAEGTDEKLRAEMEHAYIERLKLKDVGISGSIIGTKQ